MGTTETLSITGAAAMEKSPKLPEGLWPVMLTPFRAGGGIDWYGLDALTDFYIDAGASGLFACCLSSEMFELEHDERLSLVQHVIHRAGGRVPVVAVGAIGEVLAPEEDVRRIGSAGAAAVVLITSLLATTGETESCWEQRINQICEQTGNIPLGLYECPLPFKRLLSHSCLKRLALSHRFLFLKDTCCDAERIGQRVSAIQGTPLRLYNANMETALDSLRLGGAGLSAVHGNYFPELLVWLCTHPGHECAPLVQEALSHLHQSVCEHYPAAAKRALAGRGLPISEYCRKTPGPVWTVAKEEVLSGAMKRCTDWVSQLSGIPRSQ